jgi:hypothetical protein
MVQSAKSPNINPRWAHADHDEPGELTLNLIRQFGRRHRFKRRFRSSLPCRRQATSIFS